MSFKIWFTFTQEATPLLTYRASFWWYRLYHLSLKHFISFFLAKPEVKSKIILNLHIIRTLHKFYILWIRQVVFLLKDRIFYIQRLFSVLFFTKRFTLSTLVLSLLLKVRLYFLNPDCVLHLYTGCIHFLYSMPSRLQHINCYFSWCPDSVTHYSNSLLQSPIFWTYPKINVIYMHVKIKLT